MLNLGKCDMWYPYLFGSQQPMVGFSLQHHTCSTIRTDLEPRHSSKFDLNRYPDDLLTKYKTGLTGF